MIYTQLFLRNESFNFVTIGNENDDLYEVIKSLHNYATIFLGNAKSIKAACTNFLFEFRYF